MAVHFSCPAAKAEGSDGRFTGRVRELRPRDDQGDDVSRVEDMTNTVETSTPANTPQPIGAYSHIAKVGSFITIGGTAGFDPATEKLAGTDVTSQATRILESFRVMLLSVGSDLDHVIHVNVFLRDMRDYDEMNRAYVAIMGSHRPARTVIGVNELPKPEILLTMNLTAVTAE
jgi:2-iminobutanoate/2-iminopropanoate deaminase